MTTPGHSALYPGRVMHRRLRPRAHALRYRIYSLLLDINELDALDARLRWFSVGRFNLLSFRRSDIGDGTGEMRAFAARQLASAGLAFEPGAIRVLTMPRVLGFAFNPLTVWYLHDCAGTLRAVLYEVNNTFGERHHYLLPAQAERNGAIHQACAKAFHVSPFMAMDLDYAFRISAPEEEPGSKLAVAITVSDRAGPLLAAVHTAERQVLTDSALLRAFVTHPLVTLKVVGGILWEAGRLWLKRIPLHRHPGRAQARSAPDSR